MNFSVVIPTYNEEKYLERTLESIKNQISNLIKSASGGIAWEIIISDSGSTDKTKEIAEKYAAKVVVGPKRGPALARNLGARAAKYDYLIFIDADVWLEPDLFNILAKNINENEKTIVYLAKLRPDKENLFNKIIFKLYNTLNSVLIKYQGNFAIYPAQFICIRKKIFVKINGFNTKYNLSEDRDLIIRALRYGKVKFLKETYIEVSLRRIEKWGWIKFLLFHLSSHIYYTILKKPVQNKYEEVR